MIVQVVKYKTGLSDEEAAKTIAQRAPQYEALSGLRQALHPGARDRRVRRDLRVGRRGLDARLPRVGSRRDDPRGLPSRGRAASRGLRGRLCPSPRTRYRIDELSQGGGASYPRSPAASRASSRVRNASIRMIRPFPNVSHAPSRARVPHHSVGLGLAHGGPKPRSVPRQSAPWHQATVLERRERRTNSSSCPRPISTSGTSISGDSRVSLTSSRRAVRRTSLALRIPRRASSTFSCDIVPQYRADVIAFHAKRPSRFSSEAP